MGAMKEIVTEVEGLDDQFLIDQYKLYDSIISNDDSQVPHLFSATRFYFQALEQEMYYRGYLQPTEGA